jgi:aldose 1-epimerase
MIAALVLWAAAAPASAAITSRDWGKWDGKAVHLYTLTNAAGMEVKITNYGGVITSIRVPGRDGRFAKVVEGFDDLASYAGPGHGGRYGAVIGRFANRIKDQTYVLDGVTYHVTREGKPYDQRVWDARAVDGAEPELVLHLTDPDGAMGFPGTMQVTVTYTLTRGNVLRIRFHAVTDKPTVASLTNHSYFNMAGADRPGATILDQLLTMNADRYTIADEKNVPTGEIRDVAGTPFDFRKPTPIGAHIDDPDPMLQRAKGYDHNFVINGAPGTLRLAARLEDPVSGRVLEEWTTQAGVQVYTANYPPSPAAKAKGYQVHGAVALEAQAFPNAPNIPSFPSALVTPRKPLDEITEFRFLVARRPLN